MTIHLDEKTEEKIERRAKDRDRKRRRKMSVSGASVKKLQRIIIDRAKT